MKNLNPYSSGELPPIRLSDLFFHRIPDIRPDSGRIKYPAHSLFTLYSQVFPVDHDKMLNLFQLFAYAILFTTKLYRTLKLDKEDNDF